MVKLDKIYTRGGDQGQTSLGDGTRVSKYALRIEAIGAVDEANASLGLARLAACPENSEMLKKIQNDLFDLGADLCIPQDSRKSPQKLMITANHVSKLEHAIDALNESLSPLTSFVLPGGSAASAQLHFARTLVRRAERTTIHLGDTEPLNAEVIKYLNRLSDLLFVMARHENDLGQTDVLWKPGAHA